MILGRHPWRSTVTEPLYNEVLGAEIFSECLTADNISSEKRKVLSVKTVSLEEQIMSKDKYPSIFSHQMDATVFIIH